jgi:hypothetical protein
VTFPIPLGSVSLRRRNSSIYYPLSFPGLHCHGSKSARRSRHHRLSSTTSRKLARREGHAARSRRCRTTALHPDGCSPSCNGGFSFRRPPAAPLPVLGVFSSTLLPGFSGPESSVLLVDLPPSVPSPLWCSLVGLRFSSAFRRPRRQDRRASLGKAYDLPACRPAPHQFDMPDIGPRLFASARPSPRCHVAGSLFAAYAVLPHASSRPVPFGRRPCLVGVVLPSGHGGQFYFRWPHTRRSAIVPCQAHAYDPANSMTGGHGIGRGLGGGGPEKTSSRDRRLTVRQEDRRFYCRSVS